jgi:hypothetical protein
LSPAFARQIIKNSHFRFGDPYYWNRFRIVGTSAQSRLTIRRGMNITHALPNVLIGASAPAVCNYMISQGFSMFPIFYAMFFGCIACIAAMQLKKHPL